MNDALSCRHDEVARLIGRDADLERLHEFVDHIHSGGQSLLLSGDPGVGKTVLLHEATRYAREQGVRVLSAAGVEFEAGVGFAALHQLLQPVIAEVDGLSDWHRDALTTALGLRAGPRSELLVLSNATLAVLAAVAAEGPLLLIIDDVSHIDKSSAALLGFVARRLADMPVALLASSRTDEDNFLARAGLPYRSIAPLTDDAAHALLEARFPAMAPRVRQRLITEAQGNPLALLELPAALEQNPGVVEGTGALPAVLPLSRRIQAMFASRVLSLPAQSRRLLLVAVLGSGDLAALEAVAGVPVADVLAPAERARLIRIDVPEAQVAFRHPLIRSAVVELATAEELRNVHRALAELSTEDTPRAWHLSEAATGPDEEVAGLLQDVSHLQLWRGDAVGAIGLHLRAAELSPSGADRARRLAEAAYVGETVTGNLRNVGALLDSARQADPERAGGVAGAVARAYHLLHTRGEVETAHRLLKGAIDTLDDPTDAGNRLLVESVHTLQMICYFGARKELWDTFYEALGRLDPHPSNRIALTAARSMADPAHRDQPILDLLDGAFAGGDREPSPTQIVRTGNAALYVDRLPLYREALWRAVQHGREGGAVTSAIEGLLLLSADGWISGNWDEVLASSAEAAGLCETDRYQLLGHVATYYRALVLAARGDAEKARTMARQLAAWAAPRQVGFIDKAAHHVLAVDAAGRGDFETAYRHAVTVAPPAAVEYHNPLALWVTYDLVEAAVRTGRRDVAQDHILALEEANVAALSPRLEMVISGATALVTDAFEDFDRALGISETTRWPLDRARIHLSFGERLRRGRATTAAREHLNAALDIFDRLGAIEWANRTQAELRASGQPAVAARPSGVLTPQQQEIAALAATGLTNKQIGERLFLSHRTVATHLYQIFPKLGVTSRAALSDALFGERDSGYEKGPGDGHETARWRA